MNIEVNGLCVHSIRATAALFNCVVIKIEGEEVWGLGIRHCKTVCEDTVKRVGRPRYPFTCRFKIRIKGLLRRSGTANNRPAPNFLLHNYVIPPGNLNSFFRVFEVSMPPGAQLEKIRKIMDDASRHNIGMLYSRV